MYTLYGLFVFVVFCSYPFPQNQKQTSKMQRSKCWALLFTIIHLYWYGVIVGNSGTPFQKGIDLYCKYDYYGSIHLTYFYTYYLLFVFQFLNLFPEQKIRNKTVEVPFNILSAITKRQSNLRVKPIVESEIGFLLEFK